jgi:hypothetical protein
MRLQHPDFGALIRVISLQTQSSSQGAQIARHVAEFADHLASLKSPRDGSPVLESADWPTTRNGPADEKPQAPQRNGRGKRRCPVV